MPRLPSGRSPDRRRRWTLAVAYLTLLASCDSPFAPVIEEVTRIDVNPPVLTLTAGANATLTARVYAGDNVQANAKVFWSTQDPTVVTVTQEGVVTAVASGTAQVAASSGGQSRTIAVSVLQRPIALVRINPPAGTVAVGATLQLQGEALDGTGALLSNRTLEWTSSAPTVATVNGLGMVTGVAVGQATISATGEGKTGTALVSVIPTAIASISVAPNGGSLPAGGTLLLVATPRDAGGQALTGRTLEWRSSNDAIATVSASGLLTALSAGTTTITVSAPGAGPGGSTPSTSVTVTVLIPPVAMAVIVPSPASVQVGQTTTLTVNLFDASNDPLSPVGRTIVWASSNIAAATVSTSGVVSGVAVGSATITATITTPGQPTPVVASVPMTVSNQPVVSVTITPNPATVHVGYATQFTAVARDAQGQPLVGRTILWTSDNQSTATVDAASGVVSGITVGSVQIRATSEGVQGSVPVTVDLVRVGSVILAPPTASLQPTQTTQLNATARDSAGNILQGTALGSRTTTWISTNTAVATVSNTGMVTAVAVGTASVTATIGGTTGQAAITVTAAPSASQLSITTQPSASPQNDVAFAIQPVVQLKDINGNNVSTAGVSITAAITAPGTGTLGGTTTAVTNASGTATFSGLKITGTTGARTLTFSSGALTPATSGAITLQPGAATQLVIASQPPSSANSGQLFASATVVQLRDVSGNNVPQGGTLVTASVTPSAGVTLGGASTTTSAGGTATFGALSLTGPAGSYTLTFASGALTPATSSAVTLGAGSGSNLSITTQPSASAANGAVFAQQPVIQLRDGSNNPVAQAGVVVSVAILSGGGSLGGTTTATTNASGTATFSGLSIAGTVGARTLLFGASGFTAVSSSAINITPGPATALAITQQPSATSQSGAAFGTQPSVQLQDQSGNAVPQSGVSVNVSVNGAGASLIGGSSASTNGSGTATFSGLGLSGTVGTYSLSFAASGVTGAASTSISLSAGAPAVLTITTQPAGASSGSAFSTQPAVQVRDAQGNPVLQSGIPVSAAIASGSGATLSGGSASTNAGGLATFAGMSLTGTVGTFTIGFSSGSLAPATSGPVVLGPGAPAAMVIATQPGGAASGAAFTTQPAIQVRDAQGNNIATAGIAVNATVNGSGATLIGSASALTDGSGLATFAGLGLTGTVGSYTIDFSSSGVPNVTSGSISLAAGAPAQLVLTTPPSGTVASGSVLAQQPVLQVRDNAGNNVSVNGLVVTASISGGAGVSGSTATTSSGVATFSSLGVSGTAGSYTLTFSSGALAVASAPITVTSGTPSQLSVTTNPSGASSGSIFTTQPSVQVRDAQGNAVAQSGISVSVSVASGPGAALTGNTTATTDGTGLATFSGLTLTGTVGNYTLSFTSTGLAGATSGAFALGPGPAASLSIQTQPGNGANGAPVSPQPSVLVRDAQSNPVGAGITVSAAVTGGGASLAGSSAPTNGSGVATFSGLALTGPVGSYTLDFSSSGVPTVTSASFSLGAGAPAKLVMSTQPSGTVASGGTLAQAPAVQLQDAGGNNVTTDGVLVTVSVSPAGATLTGTTTVATSSGIATFAGIGLTGTVNTYTLAFASGGLTGTSSSGISLTAGAPAQLSIVTQPPSTASPSVAFSTAPVVQLRDASGNVATDAGVGITATLNGAGGVLSGTTTVQTNGSGQATFTGLSIDLGGTYTITFSSGSLTSATSSAITVSQPASQLSITAQPTTATNGVAFGVQPAIQLRDAGNNLVAQAGVQVTVSIASGSGSLIGSASATTNSSGLATFSNLGISGTVGNFTLTFSAAGLTNVTSGAIALAAGAATQVSLTAHPSTATNAQAMGGFSVQLRDASGNSTTGTVQVTATLASGSGTLSGTTQLTTTGGTATFSNLIITGLVGTYTVTFTGSGLAGTATSGSITLSAGAAATVTINTQPGNPSGVNQPLSPQPVVTVTDVSGNVVSGVTVTASKESGTGSMGGTPTALTNTSGVASFTNLSFNQTGSKTIRFTAGSVFVISGSITVP